MERPPASAQRRPGTLGPGPVPPWIQVGVGYSRMREDLEAELVALAPAWFGQGFRFYCGDGWYSLMRDLVVALRAVDPPAGFEITHVKEKFGTLRVRFEGGSQAVAGMVIATQLRSESVCEECGATAETTLRKLGGRWATRCGRCHLGAQTETATRS